VQLNEIEMIANDRYARKESAMTPKKPNRQHSNQSPDRHRDRRDDLDKELSPDIDFPEVAPGSGQTPVGGQR
jgi:hypothetical protein